MPLLFQVDPQTQAKAEQIPGLIGTANNIFQMGGMGEARKMIDRAIQDPVSFEKAHLTSIVKNMLIQKQYGHDYSSFQTAATELVNYLKKNNVSTADIQTSIDNGVSQGQTFITNQQKGLDSGVLGKILPIALAFVAPGLGSAIAAELGVSAYVGTAIANAALNIAAGADPEKAIQNAITGAVVQTGSAAAATEINSALSKVVENKELAASISNAAGSALASGATAAAKGGSQDDIIKSALAGAAGSATTAATGEAALGGAVSGGILGGAEGALAGAAGALGSAVAADTPGKTTAEATLPQDLTPEQATEIASAAGSTPEVQNLLNVLNTSLSDVQLAQALPSIAEAYPAAIQKALPQIYQIVANAANDPQYLTKISAIEGILNNFGSSISKILGPGVSLLTYSPGLNANESELLSRIQQAGVKLPDTGAGAGRGTVSPPTVTPTPSAPAPKPEIKVEPTPEASAPVIEPAPVIPEPIPEPAPVTPEPAPETVTAPAPVVTPEPTPAPAYTPEITTPSPFIVATVSEDGTRALVYDASGIPKAVSIPEGVKIEPNQSVNVDPSTGSIVLPEVTPQPSPAASATPIETPPAAPGVPGRPAEPVAAAEPKPTAEPGAGAGGGAVTPEVPVVSPEKPVEPVVETEKEPAAEKEPAKTPTETTKATGQYKPSIRTSYTVSTRGPTTKSTLAQALQGQYYPLSTTGLTAYRPAGEIESEESGKGRQDVWNEASLRLKDALGL